jgi:imidazoleglycerol-phosphate dehydratase/histidinol-phosphatase
MQKILFIDRDGTLIIEPPTDFQVDSLEKLEFLPGTFKYLSKIVEEFDYKLVMVTNQDGLGTDSFPEDTFWPAQNKMLKALENEGIVFDDILIDRSFPHENAPTRKPRTGLLTAYLNGNFDLENSFVLGDRTTDIELAKNLGAKGIFICPEGYRGNVMAEKDLQQHCVCYAHNWEEIYLFLKKKEGRTAKVLRKTNETDIVVELNLNGKGKSKIETGIGFFDHMLEQLAKHSGCDLNLRVKGDLHIDEHHSIEDLALALGQAFREALGDKRGIERYGFYTVPMDDCLATVALDFSGRPWLVWEADYRREKVGEMPTELFEHFFKSFSDTSLCNLNIRAEGKNEHHKIEATFKAWARAIKMAIKKDVNNDELPSTKGTL